MTIKSREIQADVAFTQIRGLRCLRNIETGFTSVKTEGIETTFVMDAEPKFRERFEKQEEKTKM
jgi:hypothetical protein